MGPLLNLRGSTFSKDLNFKTALGSTCDLGRAEATTAAGASPTVDLKSL